MAANEEVEAESPILRTGDHESGDNEDAIKHIMDESWHDWPNEAGVSCPFTVCPVPSFNGRTQLVGLETPKLMLECSLLVSKKFVVRSKSL